MSKLGIKEVLMNDRKMYIAAKVIKNECKKRSIDCANCPMQNICENTVRGIKQVPKDWELKQK